MRVNGSEKIKQTATMMMLLLLLMTTTMMMMMIMLIKHEKQQLVFKLSANFLNRIDKFCAQIDCVLSTLKRN